MSTFFDTPFNVADMPEQENDFQPIPAGEYTVVIKSAEIKPTKAGTGQYINVRFDITSEKYTGRVLFAIINIKNPSDVAEKIGRAQLGEIMRANNIISLQDTDQLIGATMIVKVAIGEYNGEAKNEIKSFKSAGGMVKIPKVEKSEKEAPASPGKTPPWAKK